MNLLATSVLFSRGNVTHKQLQLLCVKRKSDERYHRLLSFLNGLYTQENTQAVRTELQKFIQMYSDEIYREYCREYEDCQGEYGLL